MKKRKVIYSSTRTEEVNEMIDGIIEKYMNKRGGGKILLALMKCSDEEGTNLYQYIFEGIYD